MDKPMKCDCGAMPECLNYGPEKVFTKNFELVASRDWLRLYHCRDCGTYWQLDVDDRSDWAIKVLKPTEWDTFDDRPMRRAFIVRSHGGEADDMCIWAGCKNHVLKNMAICVDHAFPEFSQADVV